MPNRIIREDILTSESVDALDPPAEVFYRRLMSKVDDHGLYDARTAILKSHLYPLRHDRVREADITRWLAACQKAGLIVLYSHDGKPYLQMLKTKWKARSEPKYPLPTSARNCTQPQATAPLVVDVVEDVFDVKEGAPDGATPSATKKVKGTTTLTTYLADCESEGVKPIPGDDAVFAYAERVGLPAEFLALAWQWFKAKYTVGSGKAKRYTDWRATFRNAVKDCWPKYWAIDQSGAYYLTTQGKQAQREATNAG